MIEVLHVLSCLFQSSNGSSNNNMVTMNTPYNTLPPAQRLRKFQEQILNCKNELEKKQKAREGLAKMKIVFQENPKFGDEQDVTQQIIAIDENIDKLFAEIKRFEVKKFFIQLNFIFIILVLYF